MKLKQASNKNQPYTVLYISLSDTDAVYFLKSGTSQIIWGFFFVLGSSSGLHWILFKKTKNKDKERNIRHHRTLIKSHTLTHACTHICTHTQLLSGTNHLKHPFFFDCTIVLQLWDLIWCGLQWLDKKRNKSMSFVCKSGLMDHY